MKMPYPFIGLSGLQCRWSLSFRHLWPKGHFVVLSMVSLSIKIPIVFPFGKSLKHLLEKGRVYNLPNLCRVEIEAEKRGGVDGSGSGPSSPHYLRQ